MLQLLTRFRGWAVSITGALAVIVVVAGNIDKLASLLANWLRPWLTANATIEVLVDSAVNALVVVAIADGKALDTQSVRAGSTATFKVPANGRYQLIWQGAGIKTASASDILAPAETLRWRLAFKEKQDDAIVLALRLEGDARDRPTAEPTATVLASAAAVQTVRDPASRPPSTNLFPEFDRASLVIGLLETGSTNCHGSVFVKQMLVSVGCFGFSIQGWLGDVLRTLSTELPDEFAAAFEGDSLGFIRGAIGAGERQTEFLSDAAKREQLRAALLKVVQWPAFRHHYEAKVLDGYGEAMRMARQLGLRSERGVLLVFDNIIVLGAGRMRQIAARYTAQMPADPSLDERARIVRYADFLRTQLPEPARRSIEPRLRLMISGRARGGGISYDLNELGVRDDTEIAPARAQ